MNLSKFNLVQALASIIALVLYLVGPVVGIAIPMVPIGLKGTMAMKVDFIFILPVILMGITLLISILPIGKVSSAAGFIAGITTLIIGLCGGGVLIGYVKKVGTLVHLELPDLSALGISIDALGMFLSIGWGALVASLLLILSSIVGLFVMGMIDKNNGGGYTPSHSSRSSVPTAGRNTSSRTTGTSNLYRR